MSRLVDNSDYNLCNIVVGGVFHRYDKAMLWPTNVAGVKLSYIGIEAACEIVIGGNRHGSFVYARALNGVNSRLILRCAHVLQNAVVIRIGKRRVG